jgi:multiple sugar transport system substrate-binding protein
LATACAHSPTPVELKFWAMGREGEVVRDLTPEFERRHPGIRVTVQQMPWTAAHEKLLTAYVGNSPPDLVQLGNTWVPEFAAIGAIAPLDALAAASREVRPGDYFPGIWDANVIDGRLFGIPWYVDTRLLFYRTDLVAAAGVSHLPATWSGFVALLERLKPRPGVGKFGILLPLDEYNVPVILALQRGAPMLKDGGRYGAFREARFRAAFTDYVALFERGLAPRVSVSQVSNVFSQFATGDFVFYPTGPWQMGEMRQRLPADLQDKWSTAPWPAPDGDPRQSPGLSIAGGSSFAIFRASRHPREAWLLAEFLTSTAEQVAFYRATGNLPSRLSAWREPALREDSRGAAFYAQLQSVVPVPKVPEWEQIEVKLVEAAETAARGTLSIDAALTRLDAQTDRILEKRRFLLDRAKAKGR